MHNRKALDSVKGLLIIAVVLGHSILAESLIPELKAAVYSFHVQCFLLIPFLFPAPAPTARNLTDVLVRYLVPYICAVMLFSVLNAATRDVCALTWVLDVLRALLTGNANDLKQATGFYLFWFLPVLSVTIVLRSMYFNCRRQLTLLLAVLAIGGHLLLPAMPWSLKQKWPLFGVHIALFIFPLGLCVHYATRPAFLRLMRRGRLLLGLAFVVSLWLLLHRQWGANLGNLGYASYRNLHVLLLQDMVAVLAFLSLLVFSGELARVPFLSEIGKRSLPIYLWHQAFVSGIPRVFGGWSSAEDSVVWGYLVGSLSVTVGIAIPFFIARWVYSRRRLQSVLFPRSTCDFLSGLGIRDQVEIRVTRL